MIKYLKFYLSIGYEKLFNSKITFNGVNTSVQTKEQKTTQPLADKIKTTENARELQNKSYRAYEILTTGSFSETIPDEYNDGKIGPRSKQLMKKLKSLIGNNAELQNVLDGSPTNNFGDYELAAIEYILKNPDNFAGLKLKQDQESSDIDLTTQQQNITFLGIEGLEISSEMQEYLIKDFMNLNKTDFIQKLNNLVEIKLKRKLTDEELNSAMSRFNTLKDNYQNTVNGLS